MSTSPMQKALGQKIRTLRSERGHSQEHFADLCKLHRTFMGTVERGESNLSFSNLMKISGTLGITVSVMLEGIEKLAETFSLLPGSAKKKAAAKAAQDGK